MLKTKNKKTEKVKSWQSPGHLLFITLSILLFSCAYSQAQTIAPYFFGQNAWMPDSIGTHKYYGTLATHWQNVKASHCVSVRIGGIGYDNNSTTSFPASGPPTTHQLLALIDSIQVNGGEPIVQIDYADGTYDSLSAANVVTAINITNIASIQRKVKYFIIANEPNNYDVHKWASNIAPYIKSFAKTMKVADSTIKIIAPELSFYDSSIMDSLTNTAFTTDITANVPSHTYGYVDFISFHFYPFDPGYNPATRDSIINHITAPTKFKSNLDALNGRIVTANSNHGRTTSNPLKIAVTEANMVNTNPSGDTALSGISANSFIAGQFWAEMMEYCMQDSVQFLNFWSVREGASQNSSSDRGYLRQVDGSKRSTWWLFKMLANNFKGTYSAATIYSGGTRFFKAFGSYNSNQIAVMIMNQRATGSNYSYTVRLGTGAIGGSSTVKFNIPGPGLTKEYTDTLDDQSSTLLVFDSYGNIATKIRYKLSDNYSAPPNLCSTAKNYANQTALSTANIPGGVYSTITIGGTGSGAITIDSNYNTVFKAVGTIKIDGTGGLFSSGSGSLELINTTCE